MLLVMDILFVIQMYPLVCYTSNKVLWGIYESPCLFVHISCKHNFFYWQTDTDET